MRRLGLLVIAACSEPWFDGCGGAKLDRPDLICICAGPDGPTDSGQACDPLAQTGCHMGEKCTWIWDERDASGEAGHIGCVMDGTVAAGAACTFNMDPIGFDNCVEGTFCVSDLAGNGVCRQTCDPSTPSCPAGTACAAYDGAFGTPVASAGLCEPACDPLTQVRLSDSAPACGSTHVAHGSGSLFDAPEQGCYTADYVDFTCGSTPEGRGAIADFSDRQACTAPDCAFDSTHFYANGCEPGFVPFFSDTTGSSQIDCTRLCAPLDTDATKPANGAGDPAALGKLPTDPAPVAQHATCNVGQGGKEANEECRFLWPFLVDPVSGMPSTSPFNDTLGVCFHFASFTYDPTGGSDATKTEPACASLAPGSAGDIASLPDNVACDATGSSSKDCFAVFHGCYTVEESTFAAPRVRPHAFVGDGARSRRVHGLR